MIGQRGRTESTTGRTRRTLRVSAQAYSRRRTRHDLGRAAELNRRRIASDLRRLLQSLLRGPDGLHGGHERVRLPSDANESSGSGCSEARERAHAGAAGRSSERGRAIHTASAREGAINRSAVWRRLPIQSVCRFGRTLRRIGRQAEFERRVLASLERAERDPETSGKALERSRQPSVQETRCGDRATSRTIELTEGGETALCT